jgi:hypothetical protein
MPWRQRLSTRHYGVLPVLIASGVRDIANKTGQGGPNQQAPKEPNSMAVVPLRDLGLGGHRAFPLGVVSSCTTVRPLTAIVNRADVPSAARYALRVDSSMSD